MPVTSPIVVLDSGLGGLTVVRALRKVLPAEDILYFGDTARVPYGNKSGDTVTRFVGEIISYLQDYDPKHVVIACNTATALALPSIRKQFPRLTITGVVDPGAQAAVAGVGSCTAPRIGLIATEATVRSRAYEHAILHLRADAVFSATATPLLVPIIEEGRSLDDPLVRLAVQQYLAPLCKHGLDVLVLGCTHYPILKDLISHVVPPGVAVIDSAEQCAEDVNHRLTAAALRRTDQGEGVLRCFVTDDTPKFASLAERFLGLHLDIAPEWVSPESLYTPRRPEPLRAAV
jgi:glutamate racemase